MSVDLRSGAAEIVDAQRSLEQPGAPDRRGGLDGAAAEGGRRPPPARLDTVVQTEWVCMLGHAWLAIMLPLLFSVVGLAIHGSRVLNAHRDLQNIATNYCTSHGGADSDTRRHQRTHQGHLRRTASRCVDGRG